MFFFCSLLFLPSRLLPPRSTLASSSLTDTLLRYFCVVAESGSLRQDQASYFQVWRQLAPGPEVKKHPPSGFSSKLALVDLLQDRENISKSSKFEGPLSKSLVVVVVV
ncbi:hypothetical protein FB446DRAFT_744795 [Lentinula raphanica]|nr:hypothetical protein FB446DRAFT_744795 [Lentinula raphanica]